MTTHLREAGEFCWINMLSPDLPATKSFFAEVLGWTYGEIPGVGYTILVGGRAVGGLFDLNGPMTPPGTRAQIGVMIKSAALEATSASITAAGGRALAPMVVGDRTRMVVAHDCNGAAFDLFESASSAGIDVDPASHGAPSWFEGITSDLTRAEKFYAEVFGWTTKHMPMGEFEYTTFHIGEKSIAGMMPVAATKQEVPSSWATYFTVDDADEAVRRATTLGATLCVGPHDIPGVGRFAGLLSPQGVMFHVIRYSR